MTASVLPWPVSRVSVLDFEANLVTGTIMTSVHDIRSL
jgi:hypothetical protein